MRGIIAAALVASLVARGAAIGAGATGAGGGGGGGGAAGGDAEALLNKAIALAQGGRVGAAVPLFAQAASLAPGDANVQFNAGYAHMQVGDYPRALAFLQASLSLNPTFREAHVKAASVLREMGRPSDVVQHLQAAIKLDPTQANAYMYLGDTLNNLKRWPEAVGTYTTALGLVDPHFASASAAAAAATPTPDGEKGAVTSPRAAGSGGGATGTALTGAALPPAQARVVAAEVHLRMGDALANMKRPSKGKAHYARAAVLDPSHGEVLASLWFSHAELSDWGPSESGASSSSSSRDAMVALYVAEAPAKVREVDSLLAKFSGREGEMWGKLEARYGKPAVERAQAASPLPRQSPPRTLEALARAALGAAHLTIVPGGRGPGAPGDPSPLSPYRTLFLDLPPWESLPLVHSWAARLVADATTAANAVSAQAQRGKAATEAKAKAEASTGRSASIAGKDVGAAVAAAPHTRLRVGYVSRRFERYPGTQLMLGLFGSHPDRTDVFGYGHGPDDGSDERAVVSTELRGGWRDVSSPSLGLEGPRVAIEADGLHVLVDYDGLHDFNSVALLAALEASQKAAAASTSSSSSSSSSLSESPQPGPVVTTWLGFASTTGLGRRTARRPPTAAKGSGAGTKASAKLGSGLTGAGVVDYLLCDTSLVEVGGREPAEGYTESLVLLPSGYQPQDELQGPVAKAFGLAVVSRLDLAAAKPTTAQPAIASAAASAAAGAPENGDKATTSAARAWAALRRGRSAAHGFKPGAIVLACLSRNNKITPEAFEDWMAVLRSVPASVLWLQAPHDEGLPEGGSVSDRLRAEAAARGVHPSRLVFAPRADRLAYFGRLAAADLFLDSRPYGAHTVASDALWAGTPVLTLPGQAFASRVAASLYKAAARAPPPDQSPFHGHFHGGDSNDGGRDGGGDGGGSGDGDGDGHDGGAVSRSMGRRAYARFVASAAAESVLVARSRLEFVDTAVRLCRKVASARTAAAHAPSSAGARDGARGVEATDDLLNGGLPLSGLRSLVASGISPPASHLASVVSGRLAAGEAAGADETAGRGGGERRRGATIRDEAGPALFNSAAFAGGLTRAFEAMREVKVSSRTSASSAAAGGSAAAQSRALPHLFFSRS